MLTRFFEDGGPVMYAVLATWVVVLAGVLDRLAYAAARIVRRPLREVLRLAAGGQTDSARARLSSERLRAERGLGRIDSVSQIATSLGLFGTVLGLARSFFARGNELGLAAPEVLASGLATALFTTLAGLVVFLLGQGFLILWREALELSERGARELLDPSAEEGAR